MQGWSSRLRIRLQAAFAFIAYTHPAVWEFHYINEHREELQNREGQPFVRDPPLAWRQSRRKESSTAVRRRVG